MSEEMISELVRKLQQPGLDLFEQRRYRDAIIRRGAPAVRELLLLVPGDPPLLEGVITETIRAIEGNDERDRALDVLEDTLTTSGDPDVRKFCMQAVAELFPGAVHVGQRLLGFARARSIESREIRLCALKAASRLVPVQTLGRDFIALLADPDPGIVLACLRALPPYVGKLPARDTAQALEALLDPRFEMTVRCEAIDLLGRFGELDALERVMLLPLTETQEHAAVQSMVQNLLRKPRSLARIAPKNFEHLISRLFQKMNYENVDAQSKESWDEGVDVVAWCQETRIKGPERIKIIGQCKRYRPENHVRPEAIDSMIEAIRSQGATRGVILTTSDFLPAARQKASAYRSIELIDGKQLQGLFDQHFQPDLYRVQGG